jgi:cell division protein FtsW
MLKVLQRTLLVLVLAMMVLGALLVLSASGSYSQMRWDNFYLLFRSHMWKVLVAVGLMIAAWNIPYDFYRKYSKQAMIVTIVLLVVTFFVAPKTKGATRWIDLGFFQFQPSELAKLILIIHLAKLIEKKGDLLQSFNDGYRYVVVWIFVVAGLVLIQPNVSTALIIVMLGFTILFVAGAKMQHIISTLSIAGVGAGCVMMLFTHSRERILTFFSSVHTGGDINIQVKQATIALGSGGIWGLGIGQSRQSAGFLPESYQDFIFSILGEEFGFIGAVLVLLIFFAIFLIGIIIAKKANDRFSQLVAFGISFNIMISVLINSGVVSGVLPTTGITFPFISFGGTSIMLLGGSIGVLLNISRSILKEREVNGNTKQKTRKKPDMAAASA